MAVAVEAGLEDGAVEHVGGDDGHAEIGVGGDDLFQEPVKVVVERFLLFGHGIGVVDDEKDIDGAR